MIYKNVELHNVAEIKELPGCVALQRVPEEVRLALNPTAQERMLRPANCEIRFAAQPGEPVKVTLSSPGPLQVVAFSGDFRYSELILVGEEPRTIELGWNPRIVDHYDQLKTLPMRFDPYVVRLMLWGAPVRFHGVEGRGVRPPASEEVPSLRYLAYGTSITHGASALAPHLNYAAQTARRLGADLLNLGVGGSCHCEPELADYIAGRDDWDIASLALSVNMMGFSEEEFEKRVRYFVHTVAGATPHRPVACISLFRYFGDLKSGDTSHPYSKVMAFRQILRDAVQDCSSHNAHLIEGASILQDISGLTCDLIHPGDDGMIQMGENLARAMKPMLAARG